MKLKEEEIEYIKGAFSKMKSKEDLLELLNYSKRLRYGKNTVSLDMRQLNFHATDKFNTKRYISFSVKKKSGGERIIHSPTKGLKILQECLNIIFQNIYDVSPVATGFINGKSVVDNAKIHVGEVNIFNVDLKDFFTSIDQARIWGRLKAYPFNLNERENRLELANIIASLCCHRIQVERLVDGEFIKAMKYVLPQGAPTSPVLSNMICQRLDYYLSAVAKRFGLKYTRYADDITFSSSHNVYQIDSEFRKELERIIHNEGFYFNTSKTRLQKKNYRQEVTGLIVNEKINIRKRYIKGVRKWLYLWENYGYLRATDFFKIEYAIKKKNKKDIPPLANVLNGKLNYLKMVRGDQDQLYLNLKNKYEVLNKNIRQDDTIQTGLIATPNPVTMHNNTLPIVHTPQALIEILKQFSINNSALKYSTHSWEGGQDEKLFVDIDSFIKKADQEFKKFSKDFKVLNERLLAKTLSFLFNKDVKKNGWGIHRVKYGWSSPELRSEMEKDTYKKPENIIIPQYAQFQLPTKDGPQTIQKFKQVIDIFKNEIEIRDENSVLEELIIEYHDTYLKGFKMNLENLQNKNFYTDVDYFKKALSLVFENIQKRPQHRNVTYSVVEEQMSFVLQILHHDSKPKGKSIWDEKLNLQSGDLGTIKDRLLNLCDWSIESEFSEGKFRINYLVSDNSLPFHQKIDDVEGFKYIFKFYK